MIRRGWINRPAPDVPSPPHPPRRHALPPRHLTSRSRPIRRARLRPIARRLDPPLHFRLIPLVDDHLDRHLAPPHARRALPLVRLRIQAAMATLSVDFEIRRHSQPWRRFRRSIRCRPGHHLELRGLVQLGDLGARIFDGLRLARQMISNAEGILDLSSLTDCDDEFALLPSDGAVHAQQSNERVSRIRG